jgi:type IV pilus biogenesis protein CpaD/CtpE
MTMRSKTLLATAVIVAAAVSLSGCSLYGDTLDDQTNTAKPAPAAPPAPEPDGTQAKPYTATHDPYGRGYQAEYVAVPDGRQVLCIRWGGSSNSSDSLSCDFAHAVEPTGAAG